MNEYRSKSEFALRHYDNDEVNRIIRRALKLENEDTISHQDLIDTARGIGLDPKIVEAAIEQEKAATKTEKIRKIRLKRRKVGFYSHLWSYLIVNGALLLINNFTPGPWWFQWSVLGWGIGLAFHFKAVYFPHVNWRKGSKGPRIQGSKCLFSKILILGIFLA
jgi:2TM domain-containing protein